LGETDTVFDAVVDVVHFDDGEVAAVSIVIVLLGKEVGMVEATLVVLVFDFYFTGSHSSH